MKCEFCGGVVSWVGNLIDNPSTQCADCGRRNCQEVEPRFSDDWAPNPNDDQGEPAGVPLPATTCRRPAVTAYYNEIDPYAAQWLRNLIEAGHLPAGVVDERSIEDVRPDELRGFTQCHFFAGIGGWPLALRLCGWPDDRAAWTGSCPCQPFAAPGKGGGFADQRHLWPAFHHHIAERRPAIVFGEQVASKDADQWIDLVQDDLEALGYAVGAVAFPACGAGADQIRERLYWVADAAGDGRGEELAHAPRRVARDPAQGLAPGLMPSRPREWRVGLDGRRRPIEPGIEPVRDAFPGLVEQLRAYGNAIDIGAASMFIESVMEAA